jgi:hypothetical protein
MTKKALLVVAVIALIMTGLFVFMPEDVLMEPRMTPLAYLGSKPYVTLFGTWVLSVPSSTLFVYALGVQIIVLGVTLNRRGHTTWAWSLIFWGIGTILAGTSYQAFGYELKCAGRDYCLFTSWFELAYLFSTAISIALMGYAFSEDLMPKAMGILFRKVIGSALVFYTFLLMLGATTSTRFLMSYELFTLFWMPFFVFYFIRNIINFTKTKSGVDKAFIVFWLFFLGVNVSYYVYHFLGLTDWLYTSNGLWFSDNDVLHVGLILWFLFFQIRIMPELDMTEGHHD